VKKGIGISPKSETTKEVSPRSQPWLLAGGASVCVGRIVSGAAGTQGVAPNQRFK
jgi:hypothetical protein